jgi:large subunit ribosomal protein L23
MSNLLSLIKRPVVTERTAELKKTANQYVFRVIAGANKYEIKQAIEKIFKVKVSRVNTMQVRGKRRRMGTAPAGARGSWKKAIVTLHQGQEIKFVEDAK